jgi:hypothetical protein
MKLSRACARRARATGFHRAGTESNLSRADMPWATSKENCSGF